jgi:hypothetical protein
MMKSCEIGLLDEVFCEKEAGFYTPNTETFLAMAVQFHRAGH